jgi:hypothetical protein
MVEGKGLEPSLPSLIILRTSTSSGEKHPVGELGIN